MDTSLTRLVSILLKIPKIDAPATAAHVVARSASDVAIVDCRVELFALLAMMRKFGGWMRRTEEYFPYFLYKNLRFMR